MTNANQDPSNASKPPSAASGRKLPRKAKANVTGKPKAKATSKPKAKATSKPKNKVTSRKPRIAKGSAARVKAPAPVVWEVPDPAPWPSLEVAIAQPRESRPKVKAGRIVLVGLIVVALAVLGTATNVASASNPGTIKVHDGPTADPAQRNEPHVSGDLYVEGFNMAEDSGNLFFFSWPPTGDKQLVMESTWSADGGEPANHFLAGPFFLPCGHYRVGASNGPAEASEFPGGMKKKTFWVEDCASPPSCGDEGAPECPPCGTDDTPPCPTCGTDDTPPCPCGTEGQPPCPCGTEGQPPCPAPEPEPELECPSDLALAAQEVGAHDVLLTWTPANGSAGTNVYRAEGDDDFEYVTTTAADVGSYLDETTVEGHSYTYMVTALFGNRESQDCDRVEITVLPDLPTMASAGLALGGSLLAFALLGRRKA
ncbi:MAG: hypothetical protein QOJ26_244 [Thermoplasmata archaeon]|jgi:hypothetical protein|nr:hypothetical protein [Thermoplasmata archaeon]